jgi:hypothetical protein
MKELKKTVFNGAAALRLLTRTVSHFHQSQWGQDYAQIVSPLSSVCL